LFNGADNSGSVSNIAYSSKLKYKSQIESTVAASVKNTALSTSLFNDATVAINLDLDWDTVNKIATEYTAQEGREEGLYDTSYELESNGTNGAGGTPGTTSNGETGTTYDLTDGTSSSSTYTVKQYQYLPNQLVTTTNSDPGKIVYGTSTMAVTLIKNVIYNEEDCKNLGYLDNMTWDEFKAQNANPVQVNVDNDWMNMFSSATGISTNNITVLAYNVPYFYDAPKTSVLSRASFWIQIGLAVAILGILVFIVLRSARPLTVEEKEPELSVEEMLASTKENQPSVDDIDLQEKSETRKAIEKFVDENPEAVALLLRNWLNDDW
jgi:flagellar M-ring protein FliF